ncbi:LytTR family DNA-binding domain-containing protein [Bacteroidia bacterium]|jgi:two-component system LytT family response regulator|nr:LytTR family DNA-binding domain-containing protein [Bacteroidia bacterium]
MLRAVIIDDERKSRENLELLLDSFVENVQIVGTANGVLEGIRAIDKHHPDLIFLDIHLADGDGFQVLESLKDKDQNVIFVTGHEEHAVKAFRSEAIDYLLKPVCIEHLQGAVDRVRIRQTAVSDKGGIKTGQISISNNKGLSFLKTEDILYCKGDGAYTYFHLKNGSRITTSKNLKEYEIRLDRFNFFRSHKSYLINLAEIKTYIRGNGRYAVMSNGDHVSVSKRRKDTFLAALGSA